MKENIPSPTDLAPERYELEESPAYHFDFDRRKFMQVFGGGIVVLLALEETLAGRLRHHGARRGSLRGHRFL